MADRYDTSGSPEGQFQPGSGDRVLRNKPGITDPQEMENLEFDRLVQTQSELFDEIAMDQQLTVDDLCNWHKHWLESIYEWAGSYRTVAMNRDGFPFAAVPQLPRLMQDFGKRYLQRYTPCHEMNQDQLVEAMAICHVEFIVTHPFRDGNGRLEDYWRP